ncbi:hypothetical protein B0I35DRAFT_230576 [Stachybotrys elegans]|uniref:Uncharacterized protein n=1 Tax=Stachybotrys elegans TaxID=80388 RepID=A0A8K0WST2_9HYPO|nr:hypothetical protein B0I35DRAFT_230576 [Stachybotrys elegans]
MSLPQLPIDEDTLRKLSDRLLDHQLEAQLAAIRLAVRSGDVNQVAMAIPMLLALTICPAMLGTQEAIRQSQSKNKREEHRARRCNLIATCVKPSIRSRDINGKIIVLKDSKLYITNEVPTSDAEGQDSVVSGHPFAGYFLPYPDSQYEGIVSTICEDPPILNWIYVDKDTYEVKYGLRVDAQQHITGPFDCTSQDRRMTLEGWEGFVAVEEYPGIWALYFDRDDNGLRSKVALGTRVLEIELTRREKKEPKPKPDPNQPQTLDEKMKQHKEQTRREEEEREEFNRMQAEQLEAARIAEAQAREDERLGNAMRKEQEEKDMSRDMERLNVEASEAAHHPPSPSARTDTISFWSSAAGADEEDNGSDDRSVTAASSLSDRERAGDEQVYKRPYVEDVP